MTSASYPELARELNAIQAKRHAMRFSAVVRDKRRVIAEVQARNQADPDYRYNENELYDTLVSHLFKSGFHEADHFRISFARRGKKDRTAALRHSLEHAQQHYEQTFGVTSHHTAEIISATPRESTGLQAVDYFLWALQRLYEKGEDRYWEYVRSKAGLVYDMDDTRTASYGVYYTSTNPLTLAGRAKK